MIYSLEGVTKEFPCRDKSVRALDSITLAVPSGQRVALLGPSGAGKTTLFRLLNATLRASCGQVRFEGRDISAMSSSHILSIRRRIGTIYQQHNLVPSLSALENTLCGGLGRWSLLHTMRALVYPAKEDVERALVCLETVGLADKRGARADQLSGGQQQRVGIARALMQGPDIILADEPVASLAPSLAQAIIELLMRLASEGKRTLVVALHTVELAMRNFERVVALSNGRVSFDATPQDFRSEDWARVYDSHGDNNLCRQESRFDVNLRCAR